MLSFYHFDRLEKEGVLVHAVTQRSAQIPYGGSMALHTGEAPEEIIANRKKVALALGKKHALKFIVANQTHSEHICVIEETETRCWWCLEDFIEDCDALITAQKGVVLSILTADCVPILLYDPVHEVVAAIHAGWKGTKARIVAKTVKKMQKFFHSKPSELIVGVGPSIGSCCYEVGADVAGHFFEIPESYTKKGEKYMLDLPYINKYQLLEEGLKEENIEMSGICTACDVAHYFSYRREQGCSGRFMSLIGMRE